MQTLITRASPEETHDICSLKLDDEGMALMAKILRSQQKLLEPDIQAFCAANSIKNLSISTKLFRFDKLDRYESSNYADMIDDEAYNLINRLREGSFLLECVNIPDQAMESFVLITSLGYKVIRPYLSGMSHGDGLAPWAVKQLLNQHYTQGEWPCSGR